MIEPRCAVCGTPGDGTTCEHDEGLPEAVSEWTMRQELRAENRALVEALRIVIPRLTKHQVSDPVRFVLDTAAALQSASLPPQEPKR